MVISDVQQALPKDSPIMKAWDEYRSSPEFANSKRWAEFMKLVERREGGQAIEHPHLDESMWASFSTGWRAALT